jgi:hypothetical protein
MAKHFAVDIRDGHFSLASPRRSDRRRQGSTALVMPLSAACSAVHFKPMPLPGPTFKLLGLDPARVE